MPPKYTTAQKKAYKEKQQRAKPAAAKPKAAKAPRPAMQKVKGHGDYLGDILGGLASKAGQWAGNTIQGGFRKLTGFGDYRTHGPRKNSLVQRKRLGPDESSFEMGAMSVKFGGAAPRVQHREFVANINSNGSQFNTQVFRVQPGLGGDNSVFPWGHSVANCFQQYVLHGMIFEYVSTSSDFASNSALGAVMMSMQYDAERRPLTTQAEIDNNEYTTTAKPSVSFYHPVECADKDNQVSVRYVSSSNVPSLGADERLQDVGVFQLTQAGISAAAGTQIGELWVTYDIEFLKAKLPDNRLGTTWQADCVGTVTDFGVVTANGYNSLPITYRKTGANSNMLEITMPSGYDGNFLLLVTGAVPVMTGTNNAYKIAGTYGSDFTLVKLFPTNTSPSNTGEFDLASTTEVMYAATFSARTTGIEASRTIRLEVSAIASVFWAANYSVVVAPIDNQLAAQLRDAQRADEHIETIIAQRIAAALAEREEEKWTGGNTPVDEAQSESVYLPRGALSKLIEGAVGMRTPKEK